MLHREMSKKTLDPIRKLIRVRLSIDEAFRLFTEGMSTWWPLESHSIGGARARRCVCEGRVGGRIYEVQEDRSEAVWGIVKVWDPPVALSFSWYPGREPDTAQDVEVKFSTTPDGTELELVHSGWELLGDQAEDTRAGYDTGWDVVLGRYVAGSDA